MSSEPIGGALARIMARAAEMRAWEEANPEIAAAWSEADAEEDRRRTARAKARAERELLSHITSALTSMGVPLRIAEAIQEEMVLEESARRYWNTEAMKATRRFLDERKSFLVLMGGAGAGKSAAASTVLLQCKGKLYEEWEVVWAHEKGLFIRATEAGRIPRFEDGAGKWQRMLTVPWLVLDDLGVETMSDYWTERVNELLDVRYGNRLRTVLTTNLDVVAFKTRYGERIASRLAEDSIAKDAGSHDFRRDRP